MKILVTGGAGFIGSNFGRHALGHPGYSIVSCQKMKDPLDWTPKIPLEEGLRQTIEWYRDNTKWLAAIRRGEQLTNYQKYCENRNSSLQNLASNIIS